MGGKTWKGGRLISGEVGFMKGNHAIGGNLTIFIPYVYENMEEIVETFDFLGRK